MNWANDVENKNRETKRQYRLICENIAKAKSKKIKGKLLKNTTSDNNFCHIILKDDIVQFVDNIVSEEGLLIEKCSKISLFGRKRYIVILHPTRWRLLNSPASEKTV